MAPGPTPVSSLGDALAATRVDDMHSKGVIGEQIVINATEGGLKTVAARPDRLLFLTRST